LAEAFVKVNELELRVFGPVRSGNDAIIHWIVSLYPNEKACFLNNPEHGGADPYLTCRQMEHYGFAPEATVEEIRGTPKRLLLYAYEDRKHLQKANTVFLDGVFDPAFEACREAYLGRSRKQRNVLIIRDPFNCFASRMMQVRERGSKGGINDDFKQMAENWKAVARRALENDPDNDDLVILYNHWVGNKLYRKKLAATLGGRYAKDDLDSESLDAGGSPFGESDKKPKALGRLLRGWHALSLRGLRLLAWVSRSPMPVVVDTDNDLYKRWRMLRKDAQYRELFKDPELLQLSRALFGEIPGTGRFSASLSSDAEPDESAAYPAGIRRGRS
jgi:hypothetical protein